MNKSALLVVPFLLAACIAQDPPKQAKAPFVVEPGEIELTAVIDRCASYLDCNILVSPTELASSAQSGAKVKLQKGVSTDRDGCVEFLTSMLWRSSLALTWLDDKHTMADIVSMVGPRGREVLARAQQVTPEQVLARPNLKIAVTTVVPLQHVNATIATNALRPFFASTGAPAGGGTLTLGNVGSGSAILLSGMQDQVAQAIQLLRTCDVPPPPDKTPTSAVERIAELERRVKELEKRLSPETAVSQDKK
jgi:hypothetical protein